MPVSVPSVLVASCLGATGGGLFAPFEPEPEIDRVSTTGFAVTPDGSRAARVLWTDDRQDGDGEVLVYDRRGVLAYRRVDALREPHALRWHDGSLIAVATLANAILWLDEAGRVTRTWAAPGEGDCWHVNGIVTHQGRLLACAFGRFGEHRGWSGATAEAGIVFDIETGEDILRGLTAPHDPLFLDGTWIVCNSGLKEVLRLAADGATVLDRCVTGGWPRGIAYDHEHVYVGVSADRVAGTREPAAIVTLDRSTLRELGRRRLPCEEVFALEWVSPDLLHGLRTGFATNPLRARERRRLAFLDAIGGEGDATAAPLPEEHCRARLEVGGVPPTMTAASVQAASFTLANDAPVALHGTGSHPVRLGIRWATIGREVVREERQELPRTLAPGDTAAGFLTLRVPQVPGDYRLMVGVLQEDVRWFPDGASREVAVTVTPAA